MLRRTSKRIKQTSNERNKPINNEPNKPIEAEELKEKELECVVGGMIVGSPELVFLDPVSRDGVLKALIGR